MFLLCDHLRKLPVDSIYTFIALQVQHGKLLHDRILLVGGHFFKFIHFFLFVPEPAIDVGQLVKNLADPARYLGYLDIVFFKDLVRGKCEGFFINMPLDCINNIPVYFPLQLAGLRGQGRLSLRISTFTSHA